MPFSFAPLGRRPYSAMVDLPLVASVAPVAGATVIRTLELYPLSGSPIFLSTQLYTSGPTDSIPNQIFKGALSSEIKYRRGVVAGDGFGGMSSGFGQATIFNPTGEYDSLRLVGGRAIFKLGWQDVSFDRFIPMGDGIVERAPADLDNITLEFKDDNKRLEVPAAPNVYGGTGGLDGDANAKGKRKPVMLGSPPNVSAQLIDAVKLIYQYHDGASGPVSRVEDRGLALTVNATADYATYAALEAATITPSRWASCKAAGCIRLGAKSDAPPTVFAQGAVSNGLVAGSPTVGTALTDTASMVHYLLTISPANIVVDAASVLSVKEAQPAPIGYWIGPDDNSTLGQVIELLMNGISGRAGFRRDRMFELGLVALPTGTPVGDYTEMGWTSLKRLPLPPLYEIQPLRVRAAFALNWTLQPDIDATVGAGTATRRKDPYSIATSTNTVLTAAILAANHDAKESEVFKTYFTLESDAVAFCNSMLTLIAGAERELWQVTLPIEQFARDLGNVIRITDPRFNLSAGKLLAVMEADDGAEEDAILIKGFG